MNSNVDLYLLEGCGRCSYYQTQRCKVHSWPKELNQLRRIVLECGLIEEFKWSQPCYTYQNNNVLLVTSFKEYAAIAFFKGTLLNDPNNLLVKPGENSQAVRQIRYTNDKDIIDTELVIKSYIYEAIEVEKAGLKVSFKKNLEALPDELQIKFDELPNFKIAFETLTPGRQRGYVLHFSQPKQSKTRTARIEKYMDNILNGKGLNDR